MEKYLGKDKFLENTFSRDMKPGLAYGLAWTELGGQLLPVEVAIVEGKGELMLTGSLGDVMKESAQAALTFLRAHHAVLGIPLISRRTATSISTFPRAPSPRTARRRESRWPRLCFPRLPALP